MMLKNGSPRFVSAALRKAGSRAVAGPAGAGKASRSGRHYGRLLGSLAANLPAVVFNRGRSRGGMTVADAEIERWIYPREKWDAGSA